MNKLVIVITRMMELELFVFLKMMLVLLDIKMMEESLKLVFQRIRLAIKGIKTMEQE